MAANNEYSTVIGPDARFKGELEFDGSVRVDGTFEGAIRTSGSVMISKTGKMSAQISAGKITVDGTVQGNLEAAERIELTEACNLQGDVKAKTLLVKEGAVFVGHCEVGGTSKARTTQRDTNAKAIAEAASGKK